MLANATVCGPSGFAWTLGDDLGERFRKVLDRAATQRHALLEEERSPSALVRRSTIIVTLDDIRRKRCAHPFEVQR